MDFSRSFLTWNSLSALRLASHVCASHIPALFSLKAKILIPRNKSLSFDISITRIPGNIPIFLPSSHNFVRIVRSQGRIHPYFNVRLNFGSYYLILFYFIFHIKRIAISAIFITFWHHSTRGFAIESCPCQSEESLSCLELLDATNPELKLKNFPPRHCDLLDTSLIYH